MSFSFARVTEHLAELRRAAPLVHNITNLVVMHTTANALLAVGASPVMAHAREEVEEITGSADALVLNIGTLSPPWVAAMHAALGVAVGRGIPVVIDPVGAGASALRTDTALSLLEGATGGHSAVILRGNASEVMALAGADGAVKGVDSTAQTADAAGGAERLAERYGCVVCVSGAMDLVTNGELRVLLTGGSPLMARVTGMGCSASALVGAVAALADIPEPLVSRAEMALWATVSAMACMSAAGSMAVGECRGPGSFLPAFLDALYGLQGDDVARRVTVERQIL